MALSKIKTDSLADDAVTQAKIADNAVTAQMISDGTIAAADLGSSAVTNAKLSANAVTNIKVDASAAIAASKLDLSTITGPISITRASGIATTINRSGSAGTSLKIETGNIDITAGTLTMNGSTVIANNRAITATAITATGAFTSLGIDDNANATAITIDSSENVGIGISPSNTFSVGASGTVTTRYTSTDTSAFSLLQFENSGSIVLSADHGNSASSSNIIFKSDGATERMRIDSSGRVGIGNTVVANGDADDLVVGTGTGNKGLSIYTANNGTGNIYFSDGTSGTDQYDGYIAYSHSARSFFIQAGINYGLTIDGTNKILKLTDAGTERMRIDSSGRVGISESSPNAGLQITSTNNDINKIRLAYANTTHYMEVGRLAGHYRIASFEDGQALSFGTTTSAGATTERMRITSIGRVGIGDSSPDRALTVVGGAVAQLVNFDAKDDNNSNATGNPLSITYSTLQLKNSFSGAAPSANGTKVAKLAFNTVTTSGYSANASIICLADGTGYNSGVMTFNTGSNSSNLETERMRIDPAGRVGIGITPGTSYHFQVNNASGSANVAYIHTASGVGVYLSNGGNSWSQASDETLKENIVELDKQKSYDNLKNIRAINYKYLIDEDDNTKRIGFIAQDWQAKYPEIIVPDIIDDTKLGLSYTETIPVLLSALQKAQEKIEAMEARITALESA